MFGLYDTPVFEFRGHVVPSLVLRTGKLAFDSQTTR